MEHVVSTTVTVVTDDRKGGTDLAHRRLTSRFTYRNEGNQSGRPEDESRG